LQRRLTTTFGNEPTNWVAATVTGSGVWTSSALPVINAPPANTTAGVGHSAMFSVSASGAGLRYQWRFSGNALAGATNSLLIVNNVTFANAGAYDVVVYNAGGSVLSSSANLQVYVPLKIVLQPQPISLRGSTNFADYGN